MIWTLEDYQIDGLLPSPLHLCHGACIFNDCVTEIQRPEMNQWMPL